MGRLARKDFSDLAGLGRDRVGGWVFGEQIVEESRFGGLEWFGFGFADAWGARFAWGFAWGFGAGWEFKMGWKRERKHPAERAEDLAGELRGLGDEGDGFGLGLKGCGAGSSMGGYLARR